MSSTPGAAARPSAAEDRATLRAAAPLIAVLAAAGLVMILNETVLSVALPTLMHEFSISAVAAQWLSTGFLLTMAVVIPTTGFLMQRLRTRTVFATSLGLFLTGSAIAAIAPVFPVILTGRVVQAAGTAMMLPLLMTTAVREAPMRYRGTVMGLISVVISVAPAIGPTVSGLVIDSLGWRWVFWLMVLVGGVVTAAGLVLARDERVPDPVPLDIASVALSVPAFGGLVYFLAVLSDVLDGDLLGLIGLAVGLVALVLFVLRQRRLAASGRALLDLAPLKVRGFTLPLSVLSATFAVMIGSVMVLPIYLQDGLGVSVLVTGLLLLPGGLIQVFVAPVVGRLYDTYGPRPLIVPGTALLAAGMWALVPIGPDTSTAYIAGMYTVFGIGVAVVMTTMMSTGLGSLPPPLYPHGSAILNTAQQLAGAAGTALLIAMMTVGIRGRTEAGLVGADAVTGGMAPPFVLAGIVATLALVLALFVRAPRADS